MHILLILLFTACEEEPSAPTARCEACLESGGSWQPAVNACTDGCEIMDSACYTESCPPACADACDGCFVSFACMEAGCVWNQEDALSWCSEL